MTPHSVLHAPLGSEGAVLPLTKTDGTLSHLPHFNFKDFP